MRRTSETNIESELLLHSCSCLNSLKISDKKNTSIYTASINKGIYIPGYNPSSKPIRIISRISKMALKTDNRIIEKCKSEEPSIESILDTSTCCSDGSITLGRNLEIKGSNIRIIGNESECGIYFTHCISGKIYKIPHTDIVLNDPSLLLIFVPENMDKGEYELKISTTYNGSQKELKQCKSTVFEKKLVI